MGNLKNFVSYGKKIMGAGINYTAVIRQNKLEIPTEPIIFMKPTTAYIRQGQPIQIPEGWEVNEEIELGVIIGRRCRNVKDCDAAKYIGGYCLALDMTAISKLKPAREKGLPWTIGKGFDTSCPVSRFISPHEINDPHNIELWCKVNGELRQKGSTSDQIFTITQLISYLSKYMTLEPNDMVLTGTPPGNSAVKSGDLIECGIKDVITMHFSVE